MTRADLVQALAVLQHALDGRILLVRVVIDVEGNELGCVVRGTFVGRKDS